MRWHKTHRITFSNYIFNFCYRGIAYFFAFACVQLSSTSNACAQGTPSKEDQIKAAYIFNFAKFTTWPESTFANPSSPIVIGIYENDPFGILIDELVKDELIQGRSVAIKRFKTIDPIPSCHVFYVHHSNNVDLDDILQRLKGHDVLTMSDIEGFTKKGGIVKFYEDDGKMKFEVNKEMVDNSRVTISSKLLRLADICCDK